MRNKQRFNEKHGFKDDDGPLYEGGERMLVLRDEGDSDDQHYVYDPSDDELFEGGLGKGKQDEGVIRLQRRYGINEEKWNDFIDKNGLTFRNGAFYKESYIQDRGFNKWAEAADQAFKIIKWVGLAWQFKFWRMSWSYFMGNKNFLILFSKKKFKKHTVLITLISQFLCELPLMISGLVSMTELPFGEQLFFSQLDSLIVAAVLIALEFWEVATLDRIMRSLNTSVHNTRRSAAALEESDEDFAISSEDSDIDDTYPDWRNMIKAVEGNKDLYAQTKLQLQLNDLEKKMDLRCAESCGEFNTGWEKQEDERLVESFPCTPTRYKEFTGLDLDNYGKHFDNVYTDVKKQK